MFGKNSDFHINGANTNVTETLMVPVTGALKSTSAHYRKVFIF